MERPVLIIEALDPDQVDHNTTPMYDIELDSPNLSENLSVKTAEFLTPVDYKD